MKYIVAIVCAVGLSACSTVGSLRSGQPAQIIVSSRSVADITACVVARWDNSTFTVLSDVRPLQDGGTSLIIRNGYGGTGVLIDIKRVDASSRIEIYSAAMFMGTFINDVKVCAT